MFQSWLQPSRRGENPSEFPSELVSHEYAMLCSGHQPGGLHATLAKPKTAAHADTGQTGEGKPRC